MWQQYYPWVDTRVVHLPISGSCCSGDSGECVCVNSADVENWNYAYDTLSSYSAIWNSYSSFSGIPEKLEDLSALLNISGWNSAMSAVFDSADIWNSAYDIATALSSIDRTIYTSVGKYSGDLGCFGLEGDGTSAYPISLNSATELTLEYYFDAMKLLFADFRDFSNSRNWATISELSTTNSNVASNLARIIENAYEITKLWSFVHSGGEGNEYFPGEFINIDQANTISVTGLSSYNQGEGIAISGNVISNTLYPIYDENMNYSNYTAYSAGIYYNER